MESSGDDGTSLRPLGCQRKRAGRNGALRTPRSFSQGQQHELSPSRFHSPRRASRPHTRPREGRGSPGGSPRGPAAGRGQHHGNGSTARTCRQPRVWPVPRGGLGTASTDTYPGAEGHSARLTATAKRRECPPAGDRGRTPRAPGRQPSAKLRETRGPAHADAGRLPRSSEPQLSTFRMDSHAGLRGRTRPQDAARKRQRGRWDTSPAEGRPRSDERTGRAGGGERRLTSAVSFGSGRMFRN